MKIERLIVASPERFTSVPGERSCRILLEASTESEWVARHLKSLGHTVIVSDPFAALYATRSKRVKTDKRDARVLEMRERHSRRRRHLSVTGCLPHQIARNSLLTFRSRNPSEIVRR
jgi:transposase